MTPMVVGTSGFRFPDWKGAFYPAHIRERDWLAYYATMFPAVEINSTYYAIPRPSVFSGMVQATDPSFEFIVKAPKATTHEHDDNRVAAEFTESVAPLREAGRLAGVLAQFPWGFRNDERNRGYLAELAERHHDTPLFVEFRHNSWDSDAIADYLGSLKLHFVSVDEPQIGDMMPPVARATGDTGYIRLHGRNASTWWGKDTGDRYDYRYSDSELESWADSSVAMAPGLKKLYVFFNNCHAGSAPLNALRFRELARERGFAA